MAGQYFFKIDDKFLPLSGGTVSGNTYVSANLSADTLNLVNIPNNDDSLTQILARNSVNGDVEYRDVQSIISAATSQDTYVTGGTYNDVSNELLLERNDAVNIIISGFSSGAQFGTTYFVAPEGDDLTGEYGNISKPFKTITGARNQLLIDSLSGQTLIYVFPGTYDETELQYPNGKMYLSPGSLIKPSAKINGVGAGMTAVNQGTKTFTFNGNWASYLIIGKRFEVVGGSNGGIYTIISSTDVGGTTEVVVLETIPSSSVGGTLRTNEVIFLLGDTPLNAPSGSASNKFDLYGEGDIDIVKSLDDDWSKGIVTSFGSSEFYGEAVSWRMEKGVIMGSYDDSKMTFNGSSLELYGGSGYVTTVRDSSDTTFNFDRILCNGSYTFYVRYGSNPTFNGSCVVTSNVIKSTDSSQTIGIQRMGPGGRVVINSPIVESESFTLNAAQNSGGEFILNGNIVATTPSGSGIVAGLDSGNEASFTINGNITTDSNRAFWGVGSVNSNWYLNGNIESLSGSTDPILDLGSGSGSINLNGSVKNTDGGVTLDGISTGGVSVIVENLDVVADNETITSSSPQTVEILHSLSINNSLGSNITTTGLYNFTGTTNVGDLVIYNTPTNDDSLTQILGRNSTTGDVEYRDVQSIISAATSQDTYVTGSTLSGDTLVLSRNDGVELTTDLSSIIPDSDLGQILFVSTTGDDSTASKGDIHKPYRNIYAAKSGATIGDTIYVFPGTWTYDNTNSVGNPYNGNIETQVNLWKDGINYYFSPGSKVVFSNQTVTGDRMYLFSPMSSGYETCNVYGELEWEGSSIGANSSNGHTHIFYIDENQPLNEAYSCNMEIKSAISISSQPINGGSVHTGSTTTYFNLKADTVACDYSQGQSGSGGGIHLWGGGKQYNNVEVSEIRSNFFTLYLRTDDGQDGFNLNLTSNRLYSKGTTVILNRGLVGDININFKEAFITNALLQSQNNTVGTTVINGTIIDNVGTTTYPIFNLTSSNQCKTIFNGIVKPKVNSGNGRRLIQISQPNNDMIFKGDVFYDSTTSTTSNMFNLLADSELVFNGNVLGTFSGKIGNVRNGKLIIKDSHFESNTSGNVLLDNDVTSSTGTTSIRNSTFLLNNSTTDLHDGQYLNTYILNSNIKNYGSSDIFTNSTNTGLLQIQNSSLVCVSGETINVSGNAPLILNNTTTNTTFFANNISGTITEITELDIE